MLARNLSPSPVMSESMESIKRTVTTVPAGIVTPEAARALTAREGLRGGAGLGAGAGAREAAVAAPDTQLIFATSATE